MFEGNEDGVQTQESRDKAKIRNESRADVDHQHRYTVQLRLRPRTGLKKDARVATRLADHTSLLQGRRYLEARYLHRTRYAHCSKSIIILR